MSLVIPAIKSQGIKTKLVPWINDVVLHSGVSPDATWIEPFFGTGVVGLNSPLCGERIVGDTNPHIIRFYRALQDRVITSASMRAYLETEGQLLSESDEAGYVHYRDVRDRFNKEGNPYDFIFLSRAGFNGMMRFNRQGFWNIPFCKKPNRFSPAYISKICNQVARSSEVIRANEWTFLNQTFLETIKNATKNDIIYCDPPYYGRYVDYYNGWSFGDEFALFEALSKTPAKFILSTWHHNEYRENEMIKELWKSFNILTQEHFYHNGASVEHRHSMVEALVFNFDLLPQKMFVDNGELFPLD